MAKLTPLRAIRKKCLDCSCDQMREVQLCNVKNCPLYPYRLGKRPGKAVIADDTKYSGKIRSSAGGNPDALRKYREAKK